MGRFWSLVFLAVPVLGTAIMVFAALPQSGPFINHWLPENINDHGGVIDSLFMFILYLTGVIFVATGLALFWFLWKYDSGTSEEPVKFTHGSHALEVVWSILPAATLLFIAIFQMDAWADAKMRRPMITAADGSEQPQPPIAEVTGRQFEWRIRYAGRDGVIGTRDDLHTVNELHLPANEEVVLAIKSQDVLHSFFLPNLRIKQDVVPGMKQYSWFRATKTGKYDIVCAELCGWGHYKMRGRIVLQDRDRFDQWMRDAYDAQERASYELSEEE